MKQVDRETLEEIARLARYADIEIVNAEKALKDMKIAVWKLWGQVEEELRGGRKMSDEEEYIAHINEVLAARFPPLLPCPFCGGEATYTGHIVNAFLVRCKKCGCMTPSYGDELTDRKESIMQARDTWNRRVGDE